jgi:cytochrome c-type biogenesis protein CcmH/NrfF
VRLLLVLAAALAFAAPALASEQHPTLSELEGEVMCVECHTTLDMSNSPFAQRERAYIRQWIAEGDTKSEIKRKLVAQFGDAVLAAPPKHGFGLLAWLLPLIGIVGGAVELGGAAVVWSRYRREGDVEVPLHQPQLDADAERLVDDALARFDG